jgi:Putative mono-oxygenase ydhR
MKNEEAVLSVRFQSNHNSDDLSKICVEDLERFRNVPGLTQKYYLTEEKTGAISGVYIFETRTARAAFWNSALAKEIPARYGVVPETLRVEQYDMVMVLNHALAA